MNHQIKIPVLFIVCTVFLACGSTLFSQAPVFRQYETNPHYRQGDWVSYSEARFITSIAVADQFILFGTASSGVLRFDRFTEEWLYPWTTSNGLADNQVSTVAFDYDTGFTWCATGAAVSYYHPTGERWTNLYKDQFGLPFSDPIESIGIGPQEIILESVGGRTYEVSKFGGPVLNRQLRHHTGSYKWFGARVARLRELPPFFMNGDYIFDTSGYVEGSGFRRAEIVVTVRDDWDNLWVGTWGLGAGKGDIRALRLEMLPFGLANPNARSIEFQGDVLWAGGTEGDERSRGITSWNLEKGTWKYFEQRDVFALRSDQVNRIVAENDTVWFGTQHGLVSFSEESNTWRRIDLFAGLSDNEIYDIAFDDTSLWIATGSGIDRISKRTLSQTDSLGIDQLRPRDFVAVKVNDVEVMRNLVWAATNEGIYVLDTTDDESGGYAGEIEGPFTRFITSISRFKNELWFGSEQGIDVFDVDKREWRGVPEGRFFPNTAINRIVADLKVVWAATDEGVLKYDRETKNWRAFTMEDGLLDNRVNDILLDGDHVWFATESGITSFYWNDPNRID